MASINFTAIRPRVSPEFVGSRHCVPIAFTAESIYQVTMLSVTGVDKGDIVPIIISITYGSKASTQKLASNTKLTRSPNVKNLFQHTALNINLRQSRLLLAKTGSILLRKTVIPSEAISHRNAVVLSKGNPLFASANLDLAR